MVESNLLLMAILLGFSAGILVMQALDRKIIRSYRDMVERLIAVIERNNREWAEIAARLPDEEEEPRP